MNLKFINLSKLKTISIVICQGAVQLAARGSSTRLFLVGPIKVKARRSFLFIEGSPEVECFMLMISSY